MTTKTKTVTLSEFKAWLEGIEELQPKNWSPDKNQWKLIRNKIHSIIEVEREVEVYKKTPQQHTVQEPRYQNTSINQESDNVVFVEQPIAMSPEARAILNGSNLPAVGVRTNPIPIKSGNSIKTPSIDTSNGTYNSGFE